jgi:nitrogen-specific signal transduction histidine kinase
LPSKKRYPSSRGSPFETIEHDLLGDLLAEDEERLKEASKLVCEINIGATAMGTGINTSSEHAPLTWRHLATITGILTTSPDLVMETSTDITERTRKNEALQDTSPLTTAGALGASLVHELAQPLSAICAASTASLLWLDRDMPNLEEELPCLRRVVSESQRMTELFRRMRLLAKQTPPKMTRVEINEVVNDVIPFVHREVLNYSVTLKTRLAPSLPDLRGDRIQLAQVVTNLIMNGIQAMNGVKDRTRES